MFAYPVVALPIPNRRFTAVDFEAAAATAGAAASPHGDEELEEGRESMVRVDLPVLLQCEAARAERVLMR